MKLTEPDYENGLVDADILAGFTNFVDEDDEDSEIEVDIQLVGQTASTIGTAELADLGITGDDVTASQNYYAVFEVNEVFDSPDLLSFFFELDMPKEILTDGAIISQYAQLTPTADSTADKITISCTVQVGNPDATQVKEYSGTTLMDFATQGSVKYDEQNDAEVVQDSDIKKMNNIDFYALSESADWKNKVQSCLAQMQVSKQDRDPALFQEYTVLLGARIYASRSDTAPKNLAETTFTVQIDEPTYEAQVYDDTTDLPEDFEETFYILKEERVESVIDSSDGTANDVTTDLWIDYWANKAYTYSDKLEFTFNVDTSTTFFGEGN